MDKDLLSNQSTSDHAIIDGKDVHKPKPDDMSQLKIEMQPVSQPEQDTTVTMKGVTLPESTQSNQESTATAAVNIDSDTKKSGKIAMSETQNNEEKIDVGPKEDRFFRWEQYFWILGFAAES